MIRGIKLPGKKESTLLTWTVRRAKDPSLVSIPLYHPERKTCLPCVEPGAQVRTGERIANPISKDGVAVYASISGTVGGVISIQSPFGEDVMGLQIRSSGEQRMASQIHGEKNWSHYSQDDLLALFQNQGLFTTDQNMMPVHVKIRDEKESCSKTLVINGCESEPYVTSDHVLMMSHPVEILKGAMILAKAAGAEKVIVAIEDNKGEIIELMKSKIFFLRWDHVSVVSLPTRYPQGDEKVLKETFRDKKNPIVIPIATAFAVYEAVVLGKPFYERVVTVGGECVVEPRNMLLPIGISFHDAIKSCRGLLREPEKVIMGGPMRGVAQTSLNVPVMQGTEAILALPKETCKIEDAEPCIRCGKCIEVCPEPISPASITMAAEQGEWEIAKEWGSELCTECGNCSYVCPSKRPMLELMQLAGSGKSTHSLGI